MPRSRGPRAPYPSDPVCGVPRVEPPRRSTGIVETRIIEARIVRGKARGAGPNHPADVGWNDRQTLRRRNRPQMPDVPAPDASGPISLVLAALVMAAAAFLGWRQWRDMRTRP